MPRFSRIFVLKPWQYNAERGDAMATAEGTPPIIVEKHVDKGLKSGALGLVSTVVMGVASTAPAYSLAATLGLIVAVVGLGAPIIAFLAFIPMLLTSIGYS